MPDLMSLGWRGLGAGGPENHFRGYVSKMGFWFLFRRLAVMNTLSARTILISVLFAGFLVFGFEVAGSSQAAARSVESPAVFSAQALSGLETVGTAFGTVADTTDGRLGIGGFVLDETFSVVGSNFYSAFYSAWSEPEDASLYTVHVREVPTPQFGARVVVEIGDVTIFQSFLRPNARRTRKAAQQAAQRARVYVKEYHEPRDVY